ncbi:MAG: RnfABCDGE type electron transport complex subunit D [Erysipelotrichaceae bacterium]|nr:RnfABCDGE type electron transport complex subunit D [Erysipelotrichaceae bacterium]
MEIKFNPGPNIRSKRSTKQIMLYLTCGLLVVYVFGLQYYLRQGSFFLKQAILLPLASVITAVVTECLYALFLKKNVVSYLRSSFPWVTGLILALCVPINTSIHAIVMACFVGIFFGKLVFGGFGQNIFNPAGVGRAIVLTAFTGARIVDVVTAATPTTTFANHGWILSPQDMQVFLNDFGGLKNLFVGNYFGALGETSTLAILVVAVVLSLLEVIDWYIPVFYLGTLFVSALIIGAFNGIALQYALFMIFTGGAAFGGVFMLTDPVTNPNTRAGKMVFAILAAFLTALIRFKASLPEGVVFSILLVNILTPAIEKYFDGKSTDREQKDAWSVIAVAVVCIIGIVLIGLSLEPKAYASVMNTAITLRGTWW